MKVAAFLLAVLVVAPVLAVLALLTIDPYEPPSRADTTESVLVPIGRSTPQAAIPAELVVTWSKEELVPSNGVGGIVSAVLVESGSEIRNGQLIYALDGASVVALVGDTPLWRDLAHGDRGADVEAVSLLLASMGLLDGVFEEPPDVVDAQLDAAIDAYLELTGWPREVRSTPAGRKPVFPHASVLYLGTDTVQADEIRLRVGQPLPGMGETVISSQSIPETTTISMTDPAFSATTFSGSLSFVSPEVTVAIGGSPLSVMRDDLHVLRSVFDPGTTRVLGVVSTAAADPLPTVPIAAIVQGLGEMCIFDVNATPITVEVAVAQGGLAYLVDTASLPTDVIANPAESLGVRRCSS